MERAPEPQEQPVYPQPYQQPYPYYPQQPPKKDDKKLIIILLAVVIVAIILPVILSFVLYMMVIDMEPNTHMTVPTGIWGARTYISSTEVWMDFGRISPEPRPVDLEIILVANYTTDGLYTFATNNDGMLTLAAGSNVGTLTYVDLADNQRVNIGDQLRMTNLMPNSDYVLRMIWGPTGDQITSTGFSTPG